MTTRRLAAILAADMVGYSRLMGADEEGTLARLQALRREIIDPCVAGSGGRIVKSTGDGILAEFPSAVEAVRCALAMQEQTGNHEQGRAPEKRIEFRIGINVGDVMATEGDIHGDGVNVAARLETVAEPGGIVVSANAQAMAAGRLQCVFEDIGEQALKNIARPVHAYRVRSATTEVERPAPALPDKPSIAVLPFQNMSGDPEQDYFADGMAEEVITALSRFRQLFVIARNSSFKYRGQATDVKQVGRELGVRYILGGSIRKASDRLRITGLLVDAATGVQLWADRVEGELKNVFDLQDRVIMSVVARIVQQVDEAEIERARGRATNNLNAYDCYLRARAITSVSTLDKNAQGLELLERAIEIDPNFARAYALAAALHSERRSYGWMDDVSADSKEVIETARLARYAAEVGHGDAEVVALAGNALAYVAQDLDAGAALMELATQVNLNSWTAWRYSGEIKLWLGEPEVALEHLAHAERLSPVYPSIAELWSLKAHAHFMAEQYDEAAAWAARVSRGLRDFPAGWRISAASAAMAGRTDQAALALARLRELTPAVRVSSLKSFLGPYRRREDVARYQEGLRRAGLPE